MSRIHCRVCSQDKFAHEMHNAAHCRDCWRAYQNCVALRDTYHGPAYLPFLNHPDRQRRIRLYAARAELNLPLFDGVTTED